MNKFFQKLRGDFMDVRNFAMPIVALILAILVGYEIYSIGIRFLEKDSHMEKIEEKPANILLAAIEKPYKYTNYTYGYIDKIDDYPIEIRMVHSPDFSIVKIKNPIFEKSVYFNSELNVLCVTHWKNISCSEISQNSTAMPNVQEMKDLLFSTRLDNSINAMKVYIKSGAVKFNEKIGKGEVDGKKCNIIKYVLDYSKLTIEDLEKIGMSPNNPVLFVSKNYTFEYCIDNENNVLSISMDYTYFDEKRRTETKIIENGWGNINKSEFVFDELKNETETIEFFTNALNEEKSVYACSKNQTTKDTCLKNYAIQNHAPDICLLAGTLKDGCLIITILDKQRVDLCQKMDNESMKDECWTEIAWRTKNETLCTNVVDKNKKTYCVSEVIKKKRIE